MAGHSFIPQVEVLAVTDSGRRRRWTAEEKLRIVQESLAAPRMASATARRHQISRSLLTRWRREARDGMLGAGSEEVRFAAVAVTDVPKPPGLKAVAPSPPEAAGSDRIEIVLVSGRRLLVDPAIDPATLTRLVQVLERA
jgi:transposase